MPPPGTGRGAESRSVGHTHFEPPPAAGVNDSGSRGFALAVAPARGASGFGVVVGFSVVGAPGVPGGFAVAVGFSVVGTPAVPGGFGVAGRFSVVGAPAVLGGFGAAAEFGVADGFDVADGFGAAVAPAPSTRCPVPPADASRGMGLPTRGASRARGTGWTRDPEAACDGAGAVVEVGPGDPSPGAAPDAPTSLGGDLGAPRGPGAPGGAPGLPGSSTSTWPMDSR